MLKHPHLLIHFREVFCKTICACVFCSSFLLSACTQQSKPEGKITTNSLNKIIQEFTKKNDYYFPDEKILTISRDLDGDGVDEVLIAYQRLHPAWDLSMD